MAAQLHLHDLLDPAEVEAMLEGRFLTRRAHPQLPLSILNYTERAQFERVWNPVTRTCRGLVVDAAGVVRARPWGKFFNYGEGLAGGAPLDLGAPVEVTDKLDGSLGVLYPVPGGHAVATRGSFTSAQALWATALFQDRYAGRFTPDPALTYLFEIIYPGNRIVVDYGGLEDLVLLGAVETATGRAVGPSQVPGWRWRAAQVTGHGTLAQALAAPPRPNAEGLVVRFLGSGAMVKLKQDDYVALHRLVTGLNERVVWEHLAHGRELSELVGQVPDEFHGWVREVAAAFTTRFEDVLARARAAHAQVLAQVGAGAPRREYAALAVAHRPLTPYLFTLLDGRDPAAGIWKALRPVGDTRMVAYSEETA